MTDLYLFGGNVPWNSSDWTSSDDRVRGGSSQSYLEPSPNKTTARFHGTLDFNTLGGAGFASQRTTKHDDDPWDLTEYDGMKVVVERGGDSKKYTFILKDDVQPKRADGREQSTMSWEYTFGGSESATISTSTSTTTSTSSYTASSTSDASSETTTINIPWSSFTATFRGKDCTDAPPIEKQSVRRISVMMRSFFATQSGTFSLIIHSISAYKASSSSSSSSSSPPAATGKNTPMSANDSIPYTLAKEKSLNDRGDTDVVPPPPPYTSNSNPGYKLQDEKTAAVVKPDPTLALREDNGGNEYRQRWVQWFWEYIKRLGETCTRRVRLR